MGGKDLTWMFTVLIVVVIGVILAGYVEKKFFT